MNILNEAYKHCIYEDDDGSFRLVVADEIFTVSCSFYVSDLLHRHADVLFGYLMNAFERLENRCARRCTGDDE